MDKIPDKILIDTNIIIPLEDNREISPNYSELTRICAEYGIQICIHESSYQDIQKDSDQQRRSISLSKLDKYHRILRTPQTTAQKEAAFGAIRKHNDEVDTDILVSLSFDMADLLVTEDKDLRGRVRNTPLEGRVLSLIEVLTLFKRLFGAVLVDYKHVQDKFCSQYSPDQSFFSSLKQDYDGFSDWYQGCMRVQRKCWSIEQPAGLAALLIYKDESRSNSSDAAELDKLKIPGSKILKICLFKVDDGTRGEKFGEQLLKKAMDHAYRNKYDATYLTVFSKHTALVELIKKFGFERTITKENGEDVYFKLTKVIDNSLPPFEFHKFFWPCVKVAGVSKYCIPIKPEFHLRLFPEAADRATPQMSLLLDSMLPQTPGNAIRKVYVCNSQTKVMETGSILLFYRSQSSVVTTVGVLEGYQEAKDFSQLKALVGKRSVYSDYELQQMLGKKSSAKVVNFYYAENFTRPIHIRNLKSLGILKDVPQSITKMSDEGFSTLLLSLLEEKDKEIFYD